MSPRRLSSLNRFAFAVGVMLSACNGPPTVQQQPAPSAAPQSEPTQQPEGPSTEDSEPAQQAAPVAQGSTSQVLPLPNGLTAYLHVLPMGADAQVQLAFLAGSLFVAPGLAELAAKVLVESSDSSTGRPSLRRHIETLGGSVDIQVGVMTTWIDIRTPSNTVGEAVRSLRESLESATQSRAQIERMRGELVSERARKIKSDPISAIARTLLQAGRGTGAYLNALLDLDPSEVRLFQARLYRPERCVLAIGAPRRLAAMSQSVLTPTTTSIAAWQPPPAVPGPIALLDRQFKSGLYWAETPNPPGSVNVAIILRLPDPSLPKAAEWFIMHSCLTLDGSGGRLERMQDEAGLAPRRWHSRIEQTADTQAMVIRTTARIDEVPTLWRILNRARQSLLDIPPTASEIELALRWSQLNASLSAIDDADRLRLAANLRTRGVAPQWLQTRLEAMLDLNMWSREKAAAAYLETPAWMVAIGAGRPTNDADVIPFDLVPKGFSVAEQAGPTPEVLAVAGPWLARSRAATGGKEIFIRLYGFTATAKVIANQAPTATDVIRWNNMGNLTRRREILGQTVTTTVSDAGWSESLGDVRKSLGAREARLLRHEMIRNPMMLLAAHSQGKLQFRPIAQRTSGDRELMVLEAVGKEFDRLRIHIDIESNLIRVVESWERLADETLVHVRETWSDYRRTGSMRAPHRRRTSWNDGEHQTETVFSEWLPMLSKD